VAELVPTVAWDGLILSDPLWRRRPSEPRVEFLAGCLTHGGRFVASAAVLLQLGASSATADSDEQGSSA